jgi:hypothetical protein
MSDNSVDLITELISNRLSPAERRAALTRIAADSDLQSEYETQLATASLLSEAPAPTMTAAERSDLHSALRQQLNLDEALAPVVAAPSRWQRWWAPVTGLAAAAAAVIIGAVIILPESGSDDSLQLAAAEVTSTVQASGSDEAHLGGSADSVGDAVEEQTTSTAAASGALATPSAAEDGTAGTPEVAAEAGPRSVPHLPDIDLEQLSLAYAEGADDFENQLNDSAEGLDTVETSEVNGCLDETGAAASGDSLSIIAAGTFDGVEVVVLSVTPSVGDPYLVALDTSTCQELHSTRS